MYRDAVAAANPVRVTETLLKGAQRPGTGRTTWICALGKAAHGMATAAVEWLHEPVGKVQGIVVTTELPHAPLPGLEYFAGDHPLPADRSFQAAERLALFARTVAPGDHVLALISGGTSSLIGAPIDGVSLSDYRRTFEHLLGAGLDIEDMNASRRRISRWADGRLALALRHALIQPLIMSDVMSDDPATIGSGPFTPAAPSTADGFAHVAPPRVAPHDLPVRNVLESSATRGVRVERGLSLTGEAAVCGRALADFAVATSSATDGPVVFVSGGETTVTLHDRSGIGGRCQELALAAAERLATVANVRVSVLAAGTDGRDGPTDAAGAFVDNVTWQEIRNAGRDPSADLAAHSSYVALDAVGALLRTGSSGTNMLDLALVMVEPAERR